MRLELLPLILGALVIAFGIFLVADALIADGRIVPEERRRRPRAPRSRPGEALFGAAVISLGAALIGRDAWAYTTVAIIVAFVLGLAGVVLGWRYLRSQATAPAWRGDEDRRKRTTPGSQEPRAG